jgi:hypothetical protein
VQCRLVWYAAGGHLEQLYTGFLALHRSGLIGLTQESSPTPFPSSTLHHLRDIGGAHLGVVLNDGLLLHYDCHDAVELNERRLEECDFYFKRSYSRPYVQALGRHARKVFPLGLCYRVLPNGVHLPALQRAFIAARGPAAKLGALVEALDCGNRLKYHPRLRDLEALPAPDAAPRVLFLVTAYDPHDRPGRSREKIEEVAAINETRARCIAVLREALGSRFFGGFMHNPYTTRAFKPLLVEDHQVTRKGRYIRLLRSFPICVATTGLHGSIGWKFAEYVALSKAIVSEKLSYEVPGDLQAGRHYLEFTAPEQCAEQCVRLLEDRDERARLMFNNARYYRSYLRPDVLVLNSLLQALAAQARPGRFPAQRYPGDMSRTAANAA